MANLSQEFIYRLRDLGYYGEFNERDVTRICQAQPKMLHLFNFLKEELNAKDNILDQALLEEERRCVSQTQGMLSNQVAEKAREIYIETILKIPDIARSEEAEVELLEYEIASLEMQLQLREKQESLLARQCREVDRKIEALEMKAVKEVSEIED